MGRTVERERRACSRRECDEKEGGEGERIIVMNYNEYRDGRRKKNENPREIKEKEMDSVEKKKKGE